MAGRLSHEASRVMGGNGLVSRSVTSSLRLRSGMGLPVGKHIVPYKLLTVNDELVWKGLGFFASLGLLAVWNDSLQNTIFVSESFTGGLYALKMIPKVYP